jgi:hypothetical protein
MNRPSGFTRRPRVAVMSAVCLVGVVAASTAAPAPAATPRHERTALACVWKVVSAPSPGIGSATLRGVDALTPRDIWAVGSKTAQGSTLAEHWNGRKWAVVKTPNRSGYTQLEDVTAISARNVWAVGFYVPAGGSHPKTLIEHWNGNRWSVVPSPNTLAGTNVLFGVDGVSASAVYAVGTDNVDVSAGSRQITLRLEGGHWRDANAPSSASAVADVATLSANKAVAVGHRGTSGPVVEQFNGSSWVGLPTANANPGDYLSGVSAPKATVQWAVGTESGTAALQTLTMRRTAAGWSRVASRNSSPSEINVLDGVVGLSTHEAWAVGYHENSSFYNRTLVEHFSAGAWSIVKSPNVGTSHNELLDITTTRGDLWAVGYSNHPLGTKVLIESRRC